MKLYYTPGACSLSPHIVLEESGLPFELEKVDLQLKETASGHDFYLVNTKGSVPALELDDGQILTEGAVIVQYLADRVPEKGLIPVPGTMARYRVMEWLNYIATELQKSFTPIFSFREQNFFLSSVFGSSSASTSVNSFGVPSGRIKP